MKLLSSFLGALILLGIAVLFLAIGKLITGKNRLKRGSCGMVPSEKGKKRKTSNSCSLCGSKQPCDPEEEQKK